MGGGKRGERAPLLVPSAIPWDELKGKLLEECLYYLLDSLGAREIQWRVGGTGGGAADQGRDIEALVPERVEDGGVDMSRWWIEAKGRSKTVEPNAVKVAVNNSLAYAGVDVLCVATNTQFSNPTRDWVLEWQRVPGRPRIVLWDRSILERMLMRHPSVAARLFAAALSDQGRLKFVTARFWDNLIYPGSADLDRLWETQQALTWNEMARFAVLAGEASNGDLAERPWLASLSGIDRMGLLALGMANAPQLLVRAEPLGVSRDPLYAALAHTLVFSLLELNHATVAKVVRDPWQYFENHATEELLSEARTLIDQLIVEPIVQRAIDELSDVCTRPCERVHVDLRVLSEEAAERYPGRFQPMSASSSKRKAADDVRIILEELNAACQVGFPLGPNASCPLVRANASEDGLEGVLRMLQRVARARLGTATADSGEDGTPGRDPP